MSFPVTFHIGPASVSAHVIFELLAFFIGFRFFLFLRERQGDNIAEPNRIWIFIGATAGALIGSRVLGVLEDPIAWRRSDHPLLMLFSAKTIVGGLLGGLAGVEIIKKMIGETRSSGDLFTYPLMLGMMIGRVGCFLNGVAEPVYGLPTSAWTGMDLGDGIRRHPVALYEIVFLILLWLGFKLLESGSTLAEGKRFQLFMIAYLLYRLVLDFIKPVTPLFIGLSGIQWACIVGLAYYRNTIFSVIFNPKQLFTHGEQP